MTDEEAPEPAGDVASEAGKSGAADSTDDRDADHVRDDVEAARTPEAVVDDHGETGIVGALAEYLTTLEPQNLTRCLTTCLAAIGAEDLTFGTGVGCFDISARGVIVAAGILALRLLLGWGRVEGPRVGVEALLGSVCLTPIPAGPR
ncbi:hypothetical protein [Candidatus Poriferisodalis sp.]|uniref:hypothetical protein n=1 Tax=Candidatus Poriferisodalis sp. TaxID=3101277 RepID=UPI003B02AB95